MFDTFRWAWNVLTDGPELVGLTFLAGLLSVVTSFGVSPTPPTELPEVAVWVWPVSLAYVVALLVVWGVVYASGGDAIAERSRPLDARLADAVGRVPALVGAGLLMWTVSIIGLCLLVLPGIYLFHRLVLAYPAVVIDGKGPIASGKTSWSVAGGNVTKILLVSLVYFAFVGASNYVASVVGASTIAGSLVSVVGSAVVIPLFGIALGHLYLELSRNQ